jgi:Mlc titration factor MtfA (ptsG expression regulator)
VEGELRVGLVAVEAVISRTAFLFLKELTFVADRSVLFAEDLLMVLALLFCLLIVLLLSFTTGADFKLAVELLLFPADLRSEAICENDLFPPVLTAVLSALLEFCPGLVLE